MIKLQMDCIYFEFDKIYWIWYQNTVQECKLIKWHGMNETSITTSGLQWGTNL